MLLRRILQQILAGLGISFALTAVFTVAQKTLLNHDKPKTLAPEYKQAEAARAIAEGRKAISQHRVGKPVTQPFPTDAEGRQAMVDEEKEKR